MGFSWYKMKSLAVIIPYFERTELTKLCFKHLLRQSKAFDLSVFVCGDNDNIVPKGFNIIKHDNNPLGAKNNALLKATKDFDGVVIVGSDDFLSDSVWKHYRTLDLTKEVYYGFNNCHVYSVWDEKLGTDFSYTKSGNTIGVGRLWTKPTLQKMNYTLWTNSKNSGLDTDSKKRMLSKGIKEVSMDYDCHFIVDIKQDNNITNPAIVNTCDKIEDVNMIISELGNIGNEILALPKGTIKQKRRVKVSRKERIQIKKNRRNK